jgi:bacterioferritin-associated ferredoxin
VYVCLCVHMSEQNGAYGVSDPQELAVRVAVSRLCGCWKANSGFLQLLYVILTAEPSLQLCIWLLLKDYCTV